MCAVARFDHSEAGSLNELMSSLREPTTRTGPVIAVVSAAVFMASLDLFVVNVAFPELEREFVGD